jgi:DNA replication licensing factor MCM6
MCTDKIGKLISISGTVTRSSEVRPELFYAAFLCKTCGNSYPSVEQQFQYTEPHICIHCDGSKKEEFQIVIDKCAFIDWQRLRVQENVDEIPAGSMPRCVDIICRNEIVEVAKAGDKVIITGCIVVVPDAATGGGKSKGENTMKSKNSVGRSDYFGDGVHGLRKLGVREMTYKMVFIACSIQQTDQRTGSALNNFVNLSEITRNNLANNNDFEDDENNDNQENAVKFSEQEQNEIVKMRDVGNFYHKMVASFCPSVFGHEDVKRGVLLMLFGGVHKTTQEGISLRGFFFFFCILFHYVKKINFLILAQLFQIVNTIIKKLMLIMIIHTL